MALMDRLTHFQAYHLGDVHVHVKQTTTEIQTIRDNSDT